MSLPAPVTVSCPICQHRFQFVVWKTINVTVDPELRKRVLDGSIRDATCPSCEADSCINADLIYHDMDRDFMLSLVYESETNPFTVRSELLDLSKGRMSTYRLRFVTSYNQLREKILIFEAGLNDFALELLKRLVWEKKLPEKKITDDSMYFCNLESNPSGRRELLF
jgi:hypothetical protein